MSQISGVVYTKAGWKKGCVVLPGHFVNQAGRKVKVHTVFQQHDDYIIQHRSIDEKEFEKVDVFRSWEEVTSRFPKVGELINAAAV